MCLRLQSDRSGRFWVVIEAGWQLHVQAPVITHALLDATGVRFDEILLLPWKVVKKLR